jgi:hypothetical protein
MQGARHARAVIVVKLANAVDDGINLGFAHFFLAQRHFTMSVTRGGATTEVHDNF